MHALPSLLCFVLCFATQARAEGLLTVFHEETPVFSHPLPERACFGIRFLHSVAKSPVEEWFCRNNTKLYLEKTRYQDFGAGLPFAPGKGQEMRFVDKSIILDHIHTPLPSIPIRVGRIAKHTLLLPTPTGIERYPLTDFAKPGQALTIKLLEQPPKMTP
ncbi:MAG: DUF1850 domain-containing protein [Desulfovibrio sp.]|nr:DUF1850 domain-containing protein [Desulfovibrio sp.]